MLLGVRVRGKRLGIFGMGRTGRAVARRALGFDMEIRYCNRGPEVRHKAKRARCPFIRTREAAA